MRQPRQSTLSQSTPGYWGAAPPRQGSRVLTRYVHPGLGRSLLQVMADQGYWTQAAAMVFGLIVGLLLAFFALVALACLQPEFEALMVTVSRHWSPEAGALMGTLIQHTNSQWTPVYQWLLLSLSGGTALCLWLMGIHWMQQSLQAAFRLLAKPTTRRPFSLRQRVRISFIAIVSALLLLLAYGLVFMALPSTPTTTASTTDPAVWSRGHGWLLQGLRWSLALSSVALTLGLFYRLCPTCPAKMQPILPGTVLATGCWAVLPCLLKGHLQALSQYHWLYGTLGTALLVQGGLYLTILGVLMGGIYNALIDQPRLDPRSQLQPAKPLPPPPSLESFTIHRRTDPYSRRQSG